MYTRPNKSDPVDRMAHYLSEVHNGAAPMGWERYRGMASLLIQKFSLEQAVMEAAIFPEDPGYGS